MRSCPPLKSVMTQLPKCDVPDNADIVAEDVIEIARRPDEVFAVLVDDKNFFVLRPEAVDHRDITTLPGGGHSCTQVYRVRGRTVTVDSTTEEFVPGERLVDKSSGPLGATRETCAFVASSTGGTEVQGRVE